MIILDTHVLLWIDRDAAALGLSSRSMIETAWSEASVVVSVISFWEVAMLAIRGRLELPCDVNLWRSNWLEAGLRELPLDGSISLRAASLPAFHPDPADRFLVATAQGIRATLLTANQAILSWRVPSPATTPAPEPVEAGAQQRWAPSDLDSATSPTVGPFQRHSMIRFHDAMLPFAVTTHRISTPAIRTL